MPGTAEATGEEQGKGQSLKRVGLQKGSRYKTSSIESPWCPDAEFKPLLSAEVSCSLSGEPASLPVPQLASCTDAFSSTRDPVFFPAPLHDT